MLTLFTVEMIEEKTSLKQPEMYLKKKQKESKNNGTFKQSHRQAVHAYERNVQFLRTSEKRSSKMIDDVEPCLCYCMEVARVDFNCSFLFFERFYFCYCCC